MTSKSIKETGCWDGIETPVGPRNQPKPAMKSNSTSTLKTGRRRPRVRARARLVPLCLAAACVVCCSKAPPSRTDHGAPSTTVTARGNPRPVLAARDPATGRPLEHMRLSLAEILERAPAMDSRQRACHLEALPTPLAPADVQRALHFLAKPSGEIPIPVRSLATFKNDLVNLLRASQPAVASAAILAALASIDATEPDPLIRNYALQQRLAITSAHAASTHAPVAGDIWTKTKNPAGIDSGTALLHLWAQSRDGALDRDDAARLRQAALELARNPSAADGNRMTALQVCAEMDVAEAATLAHDIAASAKYSFPLRISALAALGRLGRETAGAEALLRDLSHGPDVRLRLPAREALATLGESAVQQVPRPSNPNNPTTATRDLP